MPRTFDGVNDDLVTTTGALSGMTYGTVAALFRYTSNSAFQSLFVLHSSGGSFLGSVVITDSNQMHCHNNIAGSSSGVTLSSAVWYLQVVRKATGSSVPRFSGYNYTTGAWSHAAGSAIANWVAPSSGGTVKCSWENSAEWFKGDLVARAAWSNALPWAASGAGDLILEAAGLQYSLMAWINAAPSALWVFDQADTGQTVPDLTGGGASQSSIVGTTVTAGAVSSFGYGADLFELRTSPTTGLPPDIEGPENSSTMYNKGFGKG